LLGRLLLHGMRLLRPRRTVIIRILRIGLVKLRSIGVIMLLGIVRVVHRVTGRSLHHVTPLWWPVGIHVIARIGIHHVTMVTHHGPNLLIK
jgi:hypothetical protein